MRPYIHDEWRTNSDTKWADIEGDHPMYMYGGIGWRDIPDGRTIVWYTMGSNYRICIGPTGEGYFDDAWCYSRALLELVVKVLNEWDGNGDPFDGWHRQPSTGRRRENGDPATEYVNP